MWTACIFLGIYSIPKIQHDNGSDLISCHEGFPPQWLMEQTRLRIHYLVHDQIMQDLPPTKNEDYKKMSHKQDRFPGVICYHNALKSRQNGWRLADNIFNIILKITNQFFLLRFHWISFLWVQLIVSIDKGNGLVSNRHKLLIYQCWCSWLNSSPPVPPICLSE